MQHTRRMEQMDEEQDSCSSPLSCSMRRLFAAGEQEPTSGDDATSTEQPETATASVVEGAEEAVIASVVEGAEKTATASVVEGAEETSPAEWESRRP